MNQKSDAVKLVCAIIFAGLSVQAATPTGLSSVLITNFNKEYFSLDLTAAPTNIVKGLWLTNNADGSISPSGNADVKVPASVFAGSLLLSNLNTGQAFLIDLGDGTALLVSTNIVTVTNVTYNYSYVTNYYTNVYQQFDYVTNVYTNVYQTFNNVTNYYTNVYQTFNYLTNIFTNVYQEFNYVTNIYKNSTIYYTNTTLIVNGYTNAWWNLRDDGAITPAEGRGVVMTNNISSLLSVGAASYIDVSANAPATISNVVAGAVSYAHATNGVAGHATTVLVWMPNGSGSDQTLTINALWRTNFFSPVPPALTNGTITAMYLRYVGFGDTSTSAKQTNCSVSFEYYK